jgi:hypothetical protein
MESESLDRLYGRKINVDKKQIEIKKLVKEYGQLKQSLNQGVSSEINNLNIIKRLEEITKMLKNLS